MIIDVTRSDMQRSKQQREDGQQGIEPTCPEMNLWMG